MQFLNQASLSQNKGVVERACNNLPIQLLLICNVLPCCPINLRRSIGTQWAQIARKHSAILCALLEMCFPEGGPGFPGGDRRFSCCTGMCRRRFELAPFKKVENLCLARPQTCTTPSRGLL